MSYFFGTPTSIIGNEVSKSIRKKKIDNNLDIEPIHSRHRRKHSSKLSNKTKINIDDTSEKKDSGKTKKHRRRDNERRYDENRRFVEIQEISTNDTTVTTEEIAEKNEQLSKSKMKIGRLEKICQDLKAENERITEIYDKRDNEYKKLYLHFENLSENMKEMDKDKSEILTTNDRLANENIQLTEDVSLLKILIYRLNVELERYQDKLRISRKEKNSNDKLSLGDEDHFGDSDKKKIDESWGRVNIHALGPLLEAYRENLMEKEDLIKKYGIEMNNFSGRCKEIVNENETLRTEIEDLKTRYDKRTEDIKIISEDAAIVKEQNDLLTKQTSLQKLKLQEVHSLYEKKVESMSRDNNKLHVDYIACNTELSNIRGKYEILSDGYEKLKISNDKIMPVTVHVSAIDECKRLFEELKLQYDTEKNKLTEQLKKLELSNPDNQRRLVIVTAERDHLKKQLKDLEKHFKRIQHKYDNQQQNICSIQVSRESLKRQLSKTNAYCEELIAEREKILSEREKLLLLVKEREKENENIQYLGNNIAHRMGNLKSQLHSVQKGAREQLKSVEKHIKIQEIGVDQIKSDYNRELDRLKHLVKQKEDAIGKLQRERYATQDNLELVLRAATSDDKKVKDALKNTKIRNI